MDSLFLSQLVPKNELKQPYTLLIGGLKEAIVKKLAINDNIKASELNQVNQILFDNLINQRAGDEAILPLFEALEKEIKESA